MTEFERAAPPAVRIIGSARAFAVGRIFCVGRNYESHAKEMGAATREPPFFFTKFPDAVVPSGSRLRYPPATRDFQYEGELVVAIGSEGHAVSGAQAQGLIFGYAAGLDMTRRDLQVAARDKGRPWDTGKNFEQSAPVGDITPVGQSGVLESGLLELRVNDEVRQRTDLSDMIWSVTEIITHLSALYQLRSGDLIFTGTPSGIGSVVAGDRIDLRIARLTALTATIEDT
ncbi:MAG: fumarylacetoacetate hydrolase family protein [Steroidobacteraceae bacterium]